MSQLKQSKNGGVDTSNLHGKAEEEDDKEENTEEFNEKQKVQTYDN